MKKSRNDIENEILDELCTKDYDHEKFEKFIQGHQRNNYFTGRIEVFYILPPKNNSKVRYKKYLLNFNVPKNLLKFNLSGSIRPYSVNYKLLLLEVLIYYNINFSNLNQKMINELEELLPFHNFNQLQKALYNYDNEKFKKYKKAKIKKANLPNIAPLIKRFINYKIDNGQKSEANSFKSQLKRFMLFISNKFYIDYISEIDRKVIKEYIDYLKNSSYNEFVNNKSRKSFVYRNLRAAYKFINFLLIIKDDLDEKDIPQFNLFNKMDFPNPNRVSIKHFPDWADKLVISTILNMPENNSEELRKKTIMLLFYSIGIRKKDLCTLTKHCLINKHGDKWIRIFSNKTKQMYEIPIYQDVPKYLNKCVELDMGKKDIHPTLERKCDFLFWNEYKFETFYRKVNDLVLKIGSIVKYKALKKGISLHEINNIHITAHKFRHNFAIKIKRLELDPYRIAELLGHDDLGMAQAYLQEDFDHLSDDIRDVEDDLIDKMITDEIELTDPNLLNSKEKLFDSGEKLRRVQTGWCVFNGSAPPCGSDNNCLSCSQLSFYNEQKNKEILEDLLNDNKDLLKYNNENEYLDEAKKTEKIINNINEFLREVI